MAVDTSTVQVVMPAMGDSVAEGTVLEWHKQEGDTVSADETIVEISTDKVDAEVPSPASGTITRIHAAEGDTVAVGALLAEIATNGDAAAAADGAPATGTATADSGTPVSGESPPATPDEAVAGAATEAEGVAAAEQVTGETIDIVTPTGGESVTEGTILEWSVKVGDAVKDGDTVVEISTDKVDMELPAPANGTITEILFDEGDTVTVGQVIARMSAGAGASGGGAPSGNGGGAASTAPSAPAGSAGPTPSTPTAGNGAGSNASPIARRVAASEGVDLSSVQGTARGGRITKADVLNHGNGSPPVPAAAPAGAQLITGGGAALARYMDQSRSIPTATSFRTM
ncbi:MAG TPA: biotin/lipoyl-containing protein, partial [Solirubrobacteraceae bacterium]